MQSAGAGRATRAGRYITQPGGYKAFVPAPLPPDPPLRIDAELLALLSEADQAIGRLDASADILPNPDLFVSMYVRKEAVLSSQIEGTQASLGDLIEYEASRARRRFHPDEAETVNYVNAINHGLERLKALPLSNRLLREIHAVLLHGSRGSERSPGEFRTSQNQIGGRAGTPSTAMFVPPAPADMKRSMGELETYLHLNEPAPLLIKAGLIHSQFETIHPFGDGNGRMGRLLITFLVCHRGALKRPILYLSAYFKENRQQYYDRLQAVRDEGDWEGWLKFFLTAVREVSREAAETARKIVLMREDHRRMVQETPHISAHAHELLDRLFDRPFVTVAEIASLLGVSYPTANVMVHMLEGLGLLKEVTGQARNRIFIYAPYVGLLQKGTEVAAPSQRDRVP